MSHASVTVGIRELRAAVNTASAVTERRNALPILDCVRVTADADRIAVRGTDLDITIEAGADVEAANAAAARGDFDVAVYARPLRALLGAMPGRSVRLEQVDGRLIVSGEAGGGLTARLATLPVTDFPDPATIEAAPVVLDGTQLREAIARLMPAVSDEETRYYLNGIYFEADPTPGASPALLMTATNGHVMHLTAAAAEFNLPPPNFILPRKACRLLAAMAGDAPVTLIAQQVVTERTVTIDKGKDTERKEVRKDYAVRLAFETQAGTLTTRGIDGTYPDYRRVIPQATNSTMTIEGRALRGALQAVTAISSDVWRATMIEGVPGVGVVLRVASPETGEAKMSLSCGWAGDGQELGVNAGYLSRALQGFRAPAVRIGITGPAAPMLMVAAGTNAAAPLAAGEFRAVIMPMRV